MKKTLAYIMKDLDGARRIASMVNKNTFVVTLKSTDAGVWYKKEMIRGDYETVKNWCIEHADDTGFDTDYVHQYFIEIA